MTKQVPTHQTNLAMNRSVPLEVEVGADISLQVEVSCPAGCDLRGKPVTVVAPSGIVMTTDLTTYAEKRNSTDEFALKAPEDVGEHAWSILFPRIESEEVVHEECSLPMVFRTKPHNTSLAVWDVPSPVTMNSPFKVKVGATCSAGCQMTGQLIEVRDEAGGKVGEGRLGDTPWQETVALYWAEVDLMAPVTEEVASWSVAFPTSQLELPHDDASATFSFRVAKPPDHKVTIKLIGRETLTPVGDAEVRLGLYVTSTDECGLAKLELPDGRYELSIRKDGYEAPSMTVDVSSDVTVDVEALTTLTKAEWEEKLQRFEHIPWG